MRWDILVVDVTAVPRSVPAAFGTRCVFAKRLSQPDLARMLLCSRAVRWIEFGTAILSAGALFACGGSTTSELASGGTGGVGGVAPGGCDCQAGFHCVRSNGSYECLSGSGTGGAAGGPGTGGAGGDAGVECTAAQ